MSKKAKIIEVLEAAGKLYFYLYEYDNKQKNILTRGIDLLFCKDISFLDKVLIVYAWLTKMDSKRVKQAQKAYFNAYNYRKRMVLRRIFDCFGFSGFVSLPFSEDNPDPDEAIRCFFSISNEIFYSNIYKLDKLLDDNDVIIDGGANIGLFSLYAKSLKENVSCLVFEPEVRNFQALEKNLRDYENIKLFKEGLSDKVSEGRLLISTAHGAHKLDSKLLDFSLCYDYYGSQKVKLNTIDNVVFSTNTKVDLIKLDIEGAELLALRGGVKTIPKYSPLLLVAAEHTRQQALEIIKFFRRNFRNYSFIRLNKENVLFYDPRKHLGRVKRLQDESGS